MMPMPLFGRFGHSHWRFQHQQLQPFWHCSRFWMPWFSHQAEMVCSILWRMILLGGLHGSRQCVASTF